VVEWFTNKIYVVFYGVNVNFLSELGVHVRLKILYGIWAAIYLTLTCCVWLSRGTKESVCFVYSKTWNIDVGISISYVACRTREDIFIRIRGRHKVYRIFVYTVQLNLLIFFKTKSIGNLIPNLIVKYCIHTHGTFRYNMHIMYINFDLANLTCLCSYRYLYIKL